MIFRGVVESLKRLDGSFRVHGEYKLRAFLRWRWPLNLHRNSLETPELASAEMKLCLKE
jgi:hypothetical protein